MAPPPLPLQTPLFSSLPPTTPSTLPLHLLTLATLRLLTLSPDARFSHVRQLPLSLLAELTKRYLLLLAESAKKTAEQAGRTTTNALDVIQTIDLFGGNLDTIWEWCEDRRLGDEGLQMANIGLTEPASLGVLLKDTARHVTAPNVSQILEYGPLRREEELALDSIAATRRASPSLSPSPSSPSLSLSSSLSPLPSPSPPPPPSYKEAVLQVYPPIQPTTLLNHAPSKDLMDFLPPLPDLSAGQPSSQTIEEDESGRTVKRARRAIEGSAGVPSWQRSVPYESSTLAQIQTRPLPDVAPLEAAFSIASDDPSTSSLFHFLETFNYIAFDPHLGGGSEALPLRHNPKRRRAATAIHSNILNPSDDSLAGAIPTPQPRHAKKQAGWIPYPSLNPNREDLSEPSGKAILPFPQLHPFSTQLPPSMTEALPTMVLPHPTRILAPTMHPRYPTAHSSIRTLLEQAHAGLFNRTTRLGPPGPLTETGAAGFYDVELERPNIPGWPGDTAPRMMSWNFDWEIGNENDEAVGKSALPTPAHDLVQTPGGGGMTTPGIVQTPGPSLVNHYIGPPFPHLPVRQQQQQSPTMQDTPRLPSQKPSGQNEQDASLQVEQSVPTLSQALDSVKYAQSNLLQEPFGDTSQAQLSLDMASFDTLTFDSKTVPADIGIIADSSLPASSYPYSAAGGIEFEEFGM